MTDHFDRLETRDPDERETSQFEHLRAQLATTTAPALRERLAGANIDAITDRTALAALPVLRKSDLIELQRTDPPFGGLSGRAASEFDEIFQSPGPIYEPGRSSEPDWWRFGRALFAAGIRRGDRVLNGFSYHLVPAGAMLSSGARAVGAAVLPGGVGNTEAQVALAADGGATAFIGTPDFLKVLLDKAAELGRDLSAIHRAWVSGGALFPSLRAEYAERGVTCLQGYATADLGNIAYETRPDEGLIVDEGVILEIVRPGTGDPVSEGEVGEVVVTLLNIDYPLLRFATADLSCFLSGHSACGRTGPRIKGWMGRADQTTKVKGMFVRPEQIAAILARHPEVLKARLTVSRAHEQDIMDLSIETTHPEIAATVGETMREVLKLRGEVTPVQPGGLKNDGKVIDDTRDYG
ncbi:MAG: phenylacetate--CoA ligase family protein [Pseudomonadota bacterium]